MDNITVEQVKKIAYDLNIRMYCDPVLCSECNRGVRYYFYRSKEFTLDHIFRQLGCDCAYVQAIPYPYEDFVAMLNALSPDERQKQWDAFLLSGRQEEVKTSETKKIFLNPWVTMGRKEETNQNAIADLPPLVSAHEMLQRLLGNDISPDTSNIT